MGATKAEFYRMTVSGEESENTGKNVRNGDLPGSGFLRKTMNKIYK